MLHKNIHSTLVTSWTPLTYAPCILYSLLPRQTNAQNMYLYIYIFFRLLWPCIMNAGWRERNQQDATNLMFIIKLLSQHVSGIIMPIVRRTRVCTAAYGVLHWWWWLWLCGAGTQAVCAVKVTVRLESMPETCWDKSLIINIRLVASCWFLSLHPIYIYILYIMSISTCFNAFASSSWSLSPMARRIQTRRSTYDI